MTKPENIVIAVDKDENIYYNNAPIDQTTSCRTASSTRLRRALRRRSKPLPEVHIRGDKNVRFEAVGRVILACQQAGIQKVGFITEPRNDARKPTDILKVFRHGNESATTAAKAK